MKDFLGKYYPSIKQSLHKNRILRLMETLENEKRLYKKDYHVEFDS